MFATSPYMFLNVGQIHHFRVVTPVTAYNILRSRGVPLGKRDYEGRLRTKSA